MLDPITMMMIGKAVKQGVPALAQLGLGISQNKQAKDMLANLKDPFYNIPASAVESLGLARGNAGSRMMSGQAQAQQMLDQNYANTSEDIMQSASSSGDALGALVKANATMQGGQNQLSMQAAQDYERRQRELSMALGTMAGYEDKQFQVNVVDKFNRDAAAASAMKNAAIQNKFGGVKGLSGAAGDAMATKAGGDRGLYGDRSQDGGVDTGIDTSGGKMAGSVNYTPSMQTVGGGIASSSGQPRSNPQEMEALIQSLFGMSGNTPNYKN